MAGLIAKKLAQLPIGTSVTLSYGDGTVHQESVDGIVTDNDFSENIEIKTSAGQELLLSYVVIRSLQINATNAPPISSAPVSGTSSLAGTAGAAGAAGTSPPCVPVRVSTPPTGQNPPAAPSQPPAQSVPKPAAREPLYQKNPSASVLSLSDRELKELFAGLPKNERSRLNGFYDSFQYGVKCTDRSKMSSAARSAYQVMLQDYDSGYDWSEDAARFCGGMLCRAGLNHPDVFFVGGCYWAAALCACKAKIYLDAGAYVILSALRPEQFAAHQEELLSILEISAIQQNDVSALRYLRDHMPDDFEPALRTVMTDLFAYKRITSSAQSVDNSLNILETLYTVSEIAKEAEKWSGGGETVPSAETPPVTSAAPTVPAEPKPPSFTGWIKSLKWVVNQGEILYHSGKDSCSFRYDDITNPGLRKKISECQNSTLNGRVYWVRFHIRDGWAVKIEPGEPHMTSGRVAAGRGDYQLAADFYRQAIGTPGGEDAMGEMLQCTLEQYKTDHLLQPLLEMENFYREHETDYPKSAKYLSYLGQLYRTLRDYPSARDCTRRALADPTLPPKLRTTILYQLLRCCVENEEERSDTNLMKLARKTADEWLGLYERNGLSLDMQSQQFYPRVRLWRCYACCMLGQVDKAESDLQVVLKLLPNDPHVPELRRMVAETRKRADESMRKPPERSFPADESDRPSDEYPAPAAENTLPEPVSVSGGETPSAPVDASGNGGEIPTSPTVEPVADDDENHDDADDETDEEDDIPPEADEDEEMEIVPYEDHDGWPALHLTKREVMDYALQLSEPGAIPVALAYIRAAAALNPDLIPLRRLAALAANDPMESPDYSVTSLLSALEISDTDYPAFSDCCMGAAFLRASFLSGLGYDYNARSLRDSIAIAQKIPVLRATYDTLEYFRTIVGCSMDIYADYRNLGAKQLQDDMNFTVRHAGELYEKFIKNPPREDVKFARLLETKKIVFAQDGYLATILRAVVEEDRDTLDAQKNTFAARFLDGSAQFTEKYVSAKQIDALIAESWDLAAKPLFMKKANATLQGDRRNNLRSNIGEIVRTVCQWYALSEQSAGLAWRTELGADTYKKLRPTLEEQLHQLRADCETHMDDGPEYRLGLLLLSATAKELSARLDGSWCFEQEQYLYADFLGSDWILLREDFTPDLSSTFCVLPEWNILARIRAHAEGPRLDFQEHIDRIYGPERAGNNYGTADRIVEYLTALGRAGEISVPENAPQFIAQTELQMKMSFRGFLEMYALARNYGQIMQSDAFCYTLEDTIRYWYVQSRQSRNYGFFTGILQHSEGQIHRSAQQYERQLAEQLDALIAGNQEQFEQHPGYAEAIRGQIAQQNFIVAEDWMNKIRDHDFSLNVEQPEALGYLEQFWNDYAANYRRVSDSGRSLSALLGRKFPRNKDTKGAQKLISVWTSGGSASNALRVEQLLELLGWQKVQVSPYRFPTDPRTEIYYIRQDPDVANMTAPLHPIAAFGSRVARDGMYAVCLYGTYDCDRLYEKIRTLDSLDGNKIILLDYALSGADRRALARKLKQKESGLRGVYLVIDRILLCHIANTYNGNLVNRMLMAAGMPFSYCQPYVVESSHTMPPEIFIGRRDELLRIEQPDGVNLIYGGRQLGKSALFKKARGDLDGNQNRRAVLVDIKDCSCAEAARKLSTELMETGILPDFTPVSDWETLCSAIRQRLRLQNDIRYLLVMLDEADAFIEDCGTQDYKPLARLKDIQQTLPGQFKFVLAGLHSIVRFNREVALGRNSVITHFPSLKITPFRTPEAQELLTVPLSYLGLSLPSKVTVSQILATVNYFPGLIQLYCQKLIESLRAADYAGYDVKNTPPYVITDDHLRRVMADKEFVEQIHEKFEITLRLDQDQGSCYYPLTLLIGLMYSVDPSQNGYTAADVLRHAKDLGVHPIVDLDAEKIDALLQELRDLNILRSISHDTYLLASKNFRDLLGSDDEIFEKLSKVGVNGT